MTIVLLSYNLNIKIHDLLHIILDFCIFFCIIDDMQIILNPKSNRRFTYTDRLDGYFEQWFNDQQLENGYHRYETRYLSGFSFMDNPLTEYDVDVYPWKFAVQNSADTFESALLINERAFYIRSSKKFSVNNLVPSHKVSEENSKTGFVRNYYKPLYTQEWQKIELGQYTFVKDYKGNAICSFNNFEYDIVEKDVVITPSIIDQIFYVVMEDSDSACDIHSIELLQSDAMSDNKKIIDDFMFKSTVTTDNTIFDKATLWSKYTAWLLVTSNKNTKYRGIWAGLPWFRDNWGRDTFISLCGTLLVSGDFEEAKNVLMGFAGFQDLNKSSTSYGRIPNRYRDEEDVIYNTVDGTLWFIRGIWEYVNYSGDESILCQLKDTIEIALDAESLRVDDNGFITHDDADTWMDARIKGNEPWSPRGNRANDIQSLWFTALRIGAIIEERYGSTAKAKTYDLLADKVKTNFQTLYWDSENYIFADHINTDDTKDFKIRPNQLFVIYVTSILPRSEKNSLLSYEVSKAIVENCRRDLLNPFGLFSLDSGNKAFHPKHENPDLYHKDAAYHNGTIWEWNTGAFISDECMLNGYLSDQSSAILQNYARLILKYGSAGSLSENIHALPDSDGNPVLSGTFSQCWSMAEFNRNIYQDILGFVPLLTDRCLRLNPCLPKGVDHMKGKCLFGKNSSINIDVKRSEEGYICTVFWDGTESYKELFVNDTKIRCGIESTICIRKKLVEQTTMFDCPDMWITDAFPELDLCPKDNGPLSKQDYLEKLILSGGSW